MMGWIINSESSSLGSCFSCPVQLVRVACMEPLLWRINISNYFEKVLRQLYGHGLLGVCRCNRVLSDHSGALVNLHHVRLGLLPLHYLRNKPVYILWSLFATKSGRSRVLVACGGSYVDRTALSWKQELYLAVSSFQGFLQYGSLALPGIIVISEW